MLWLCCVFAKCIDSNDRDQNSEELALDKEVALCEALGAPLSDELKRRLKHAERRKLIEAKELSMAIFQSLQPADDKVESKEAVVDMGAGLDMALDHKHAPRG